MCPCGPSSLDRSLTTDELVGVTFLARSAAIEELAQRAEQLLMGPCPEEFKLAATWLTRLGRQYPADGGVAVAALLNCVRLEAGEALFLDAGNMHAYLCGLGVEIMANSDNVIRGGMTSKHVDVDVLTRLVDTDPLSDPVIRPTRSKLEGGADLETWPVSGFGLCPHPGNGFAGCTGYIAGVERSFDRFVFRRNAAHYEPRRNGRSAERPGRGESGVH